MASTRSSFTIDRVLAERARRLKINVSAAARQGVEAAVRAAMARADRDAYRRRPERADPSWSDVEAWTEE
jgi:post-segregation antitoxin (ccd killing protein)